MQDISTLLQEYTFDFAQYLEVKEVWLGFLITLSVLAAIYVLLLIFFIKRIRIATRLLAEASKVSANSPIVIVLVVFFNSFKLSTETIQITLIF